MEPSEIIAPATPEDGRSKEGQWQFCCYHGFQVCLVVTEIHRGGRRVSNVIRMGWAGYKCLPTEKQGVVILLVQPFVWVYRDFTIAGGNGLKAAKDPCCLV